MNTYPAVYRLSDWKETVVFERPDGVKVTRVDAEFSYEGELAGSTTVAYLLQYYADGSGSYSGWERFSGSFREKQAEAVMAHSGTFTAEAVELSVSSVPGAGTGALEDVALSYSAQLKGPGPYDLAIAVG